VERTPSTYHAAQPFPIARQEGSGARQRVCNYTGEVIPRGEQGDVDHVCEIDVWNTLMRAASKALAWRGHLLAFPEEARLACQEVANCPHNLMRVSSNGHSQKTTAFAAAKKAALNHCTALPWASLRYTLLPMPVEGRPAVTGNAWEAMLECHVRLGLLMGHQAQLMTTCPGKKLCMWIARALANLGGVEYHYPLPPPRKKAAGGGGGQSACDTYGSSLLASDEVSSDTEEEEEGLKLAEAEAEAEVTAEGELEGEGLTLRVPVMVADSVSVTLLVREG